MGVVHARPAMAECHSVPHRKQSGRGYMPPNSVCNLNSKILDYSMGIGVLVRIVVVAFRRFERDFCLRNFSHWD